MATAVSGDREPITEEQFVLLRCRIQSLSVRVHEMAEELTELVRDMDSLRVADVVTDSVSVGFVKQSVGRAKRYRPFRTSTEFEQAVSQHGGAVYRKHTTIARRNEPAKRHHQFAVGAAGLYVDGNHYLWEDLFSFWAFADGTPCGQPIT